MSQVSTLHAALVTRLTTLFPLSGDAAYSRLANAYQLEKNNDAFLKKGWALGVGPGSPRSTHHCKYEIDRVFKISLTREAMKTDSDAVGFAEVELLLLEDLRSMIHDFEKNTTLNTGTGFTGFVSDSGIQQVKGNQSYLYIEAEFGVRLIETLT